MSPKASADALDRSANWPAASYGPVSKLFYVRVTDGCAIYKKNPAPIDVGQRFFGGSAAGQPGSQSFIRALDIRSGRKAWDYALVSGGVLDLPESADDFVTTPRRLFQ